MFILWLWMCFREEREVWEEFLKKEKMVNTCLFIMGQERQVNELGSRDEQFWSIELESCILVSNTGIIWIRTRIRIYLQVFISAKILFQFVEYNYENLCMRWNFSFRFLVSKFWKKKFTKQPTRSFIKWWCSWVNEKEILNQTRTQRNKWKLATSCWREKRTWKFKDDK